MPNDDYIDNRSFDELVASTTPNEKYDHVVQNILRDKRQGWIHNYYKSDGKSSCDAEIGRMNMEVSSRSQNIAINERLLEVLNENIRKSNAKKSQLEAWDKQYVQAEEDIAYDRSRIDELNVLLLKWNWNRYLELSTENSIQRSRNRYMYDADETYLRKGVTMACSYNEKARYQLFDMPPQYQVTDNSDF